MNQQHPQNGWAYHLLFGSGVVMTLCLLYQSIRFYHRQTLLDTLLMAGLGGLFAIGSLVAGIECYRACRPRPASNHTDGKGS
ncbi:MAG TPA: hypothetical protein VKT32_13520 [Chthonomonadaceae bacterium]|nr:hypothetical protein [Chthonomonadaceae bacterium]